VVDPFKKWREKVNTRKQEKKEIADKRYAKYLYDKYKLHDYLFNVRVKYLEPLKHWYTYNVVDNPELKNNINKFFEEEQNKFTDDEIIKLIININNDAKIIKKRDSLASKLSEMATKLNDDIEKFREEYSIELKISFQDFKEQNNNSLSSCPDGRCYGAQTGIDLDDELFDITEIPKFSGGKRKKKTQNRKPRIRRTNKN